MNKVSKLGKEILEIALQNSDDFVSVRSSNEQFDFFQIADRSLEAKLFNGKLSENESVTFSYWETLTGQKTLNINDDENFIEAFARSGISGTDLPSHFICGKHRYTPSPDCSIDSSDYVIYYIQKPQREQLFRASFFRK